MSLNKRYKIILASLVTLVACLVHTQSVQAFEYTNGKCQGFAAVGNKMYIFNITTEEDLPLNTEPPAELQFCVEAPAASSSIRWVDLRNSIDFFKNHADSWQHNPEFVREEQQRICDAVDNFTNWTTTKDYTQPANMEYKLVTNVFHSCPVGSDGYPRQRYRLQVESDFGSDRYLYFMSEAPAAALGGQFPNPALVCTQADGKDKTTCEAISSEGVKPCYWRQASAKCSAKADTTIKCSDLTAGATGECSSALHCKLGDNNTCVERNVQISQSQAISQYITSTHGMPDGYTGPLPACAFTGECRSVEDLVQLGVNVANWLFGIIAGLGFAFFVYGGITMILSFGNSEKVSQGKQMLVAATIGMVIAFSAYILVGFIVKAIGINPTLTPFN